MPKTDCDAHGWNFEPDDTCPICDGIELGRERVIALLEARRYDLASCLKDDDCEVRADAIQVCISDIKGEIE
jgi:hypothetical protein